MTSRLRYLLPIPFLVAAAVALAKNDGPGGDLRAQLNLDHSAPERVTAEAGYANVVEKVAPSVVSILVTQKASARQTADTPDLFNDPFFRRFFEDMNPEQLQPRQQRPQPRRQGQGSGVILTPDGYIVTNNHVVDGADEEGGIIVKLADSREEYEAKVIGTDPATDLALIKIEGKNLPAATLGDSSKLRVGDTVLAIGNPFGLDQTVTSGIVSALNRNNMNIAGYENFIQTDASINPGNSGGALIDHEGRVVGINTAIFSRVGGNIGIGFAIPANMTVDIIDRLQSKGTVERGYLGVMLGELTRDLAEGFGLPDQDCVLVQDVMDNTPASKAGFEAGDVIRSYQGKDITDMAELRMLVASTMPGSQAEFGIVRGGKERSLTAKIGLLPENPQLARSSSNGSQPQDNNVTTFLDGVEIVSLTPEIKSRYRLSKEIKSGVLVTEVDANSAAGKAGLSAGDVITEVDRKPVTDVSEAKKALDAAKVDVLLLRVTNGEGSRFVAVEQ